eukprot:GEMP01039065.1.p1 GENE.GEMP01039065.1~~GEMP01039065.1.p1  ORF type:complete len:240 (-),score=34.64 GEMP01039065.1:1131-1850(-)
MSQSPEAWFKALPPITRYGLVTIFATTCLVQVEILDPYLIIFQWPLIYQKLQIWRILTSMIFFGGFSFGFVFQMYFFTSFSTKLEKNEVFTQPGDYAFFLLFQTVFLCVFGVLLAWPMGFPMLGPSMIFAIIYYWSRREPYAQLSFFSFSIKAYQFPFVLMFVQVLMGNSLWADLIGLASGHLYYFLKEIVPAEYGYTILTTPAILNKVMSGVVPRAPGAPTTTPPPNRFGGGGQRLGD